MDKGISALCDEMTDRPIGLKRSGPGIVYLTDGEEIGK
jgi:hypothetical protein